MSIIINNCLVGENTIKPAQACCIKVIRPLDVAPPLGKPHPCEGSTAPLARGLAGGELIYGEHLFAKVSSNFDFGA